jgi:hypothetical protein
VYHWCELAYCIQRTEVATQVIHYIGVITQKIMVELSTKEYSIIFRWFERSFAKSPPQDIPIEDKRVFWKLTFLAEDKIEEEKLSGAKEHEDT